MDDLLDQLLAGGTDEASLGDAIRSLRKRGIERLLEAKLADHLGYNKHEAVGYNGGNSRNGHQKKTIKSESGTLLVQVPRDREGSFEPKLITKGQRRLKGFDDKVLSLYARGLTTRDIQSHIREIYDVEITPDLVSRITDSVMDDVRDWQSRTLDKVYPIVYFDGMVVKVKEDGVYRNRTVHLALAINIQGHKEVLGMWMTRNEGAKFWMSVVNELKLRGVEDIVIAAVDGLKGFPEAIEAVFAQTVVQTCVVHMIRSSTRLVSWKNRRALIKDLKPVYKAITENVALEALDDFEAKWGKQYPSVVSSWRNNWLRISPFFEFSAEIRTAIYTTNPIESLNRQLRKATKTRGTFPTDGSVQKLMWMVIDNLSKKWVHPKHHWDTTLQQLAIHFPGRIPLELYSAPNG
jgi:putative transposase